MRQIIASRYLLRLAGYRLHGDFVELSSGGGDGSLQFYRHRSLRSGRQRVG